MSSKPVMNKRKRKRISPLKRGDYFWGYAMIAPTLIGLLVLYIWPSIQTFYFSLNTWKAFGNYEWGGLSNYKRILEDPDLITALKNTLIFSVLSVPLSIAIAIFVALLLNQKIKGLSIYRTLYFLPVVTIPAAIAMVWKWLYTAEYGLINYVLGIFSIEGPNWLTNPDLALYSIIIVSVWMQIGYYMIFFLSGLQGIPNSLYEAASIDGAGAVRKFFTITLPLLTPTIFFVTIISLIEALQVFDLIFMMIEPTSPAYQDTRTLVVLFFEQAFKMNDKGFASAIAILIFLLIFVVTIIQVKLQKKWVHYD
ncbi:carbohydrate ABC transporter permease [Thalassobacillus pellis]|uniref:carbohydrate ABC transporter permease n=1 Tax=Thalassobacillus pellis TaxID=748008 RepID=UPI0019612E9D|nr:sugar ABC transporter permease [Thalassobacillus pellis]MBM7551580.1 multiple sugar transport system permease protein [Thalassobacillus pellis]